MTYKKYCTEHRDNATTQQTNKKQCVEVLMEGCNVQLTTLFQTGWVIAYRLLVFPFATLQMWPAFFCVVIFVSSVLAVLFKGFQISWQANCFLICVVWLFLIDRNSYRCAPFINTKHNWTTYISTEWQTNQANNTNSYNKSYSKALKKYYSEQKEHTSHAIS